MKKQHRMEENICKLYLIRDLYLEYIKNSCNPIINDNPVKNGKGSQ